MDADRTNKVFLPSYENSKHHLNNSTGSLQPPSARTGVVAWCHTLTVSMALDTSTAQSSKWRGYATRLGRSVQGNG